MPGLRHDGKTYDASSKGLASIRAAHLWFGW